MYDTMRDDYLTWDAYWVWLKAKITLIKKYWFIKKNFSEKEINEIKKTQDKSVNLLLNK